MRVAALTKPQQIEILETQAPQLTEPDDVLVTMVSVGLCGTDLGYWSGYRTALRYPWVLGHEGVGIVSAVGSDVTVVRTGALVTIEPNYPCHECDLCGSGNTSLCTRRVSLGLNAPGLLSEQVVIPQQYVWPVPDGVSVQAAVCAEPLAVALTGVRRAGASVWQGPALVVGAGAQGLLTVEVLRSVGVETAVVEPQEARRELAYQRGARAPREGEMFHTIFETSGSGHGASSAVELLAPKGVGVLIGVGDVPMSVDTKTIVRRGLTISGSMIYDHPTDFLATLDLMAQQQVRPEHVLGTPYVLEEAHQAFVSAATGVGKTWILFEESVEAFEVKHGSVVWA